MFKTRIIIKRIILKRIRRKKKTKRTRRKIITTLKIKTRKWIKIKIIIRRRITKTKTIIIRIIKIIIIKTRILITLTIKLRIFKNLIIVTIIIILLKHKLLITRYFWRWFHKRRQLITNMVKQHAQKKHRFRFQR